MPSGIEIFNYNSRHEFSVIYLRYRIELYNFKIMVKQGKKTTKAEKPEEPKKLSKIGEWLKSGQSVGHIVDMRAVLK